MNKLAALLEKRLSDFMEHQVAEANAAYENSRTQLLIQMVMKTQTEITRPAGQGHAQLGVFVRVHLHETSPSNALSDGRD
mgnify:CR=1 FL=1